MPIVNSIDGRCLGDKVTITLTFPTGIGRSEFELVRLRIFFCILHTRLAYKTRGPAAGNRLKSAKPELNMSQSTKQQGAGRSCGACTACCDGWLIPIHLRRITILAWRGETKIAQARQHFARALALKPDFLEAKLAQCIAELAPVYASAAEIDERRAAYADRLAVLSTKLESIAVPATFVDAIGAHQPFYLPYQGRNDRELQVQFGAAVCKVMAARYQPLDMPAPPAADEPIRLGIVSGFFRQHSNWKIPIKGWLKMLDRTRFRVLGYHTGVEYDGETAAAARCASASLQGRVRSIRGGRRSPATHRMCCCVPKSGWTRYRRSSQRCALRRFSARRGAIPSPAASRRSTILHPAT
jgi:hypothetical protein